MEYIHNMAWHVLPAPPGMYFVTCDTPAHIFEGLGVGRTDSEFTFTDLEGFHPYWRALPQLGSSV